MLDPITPVPIQPIRVLPGAIVGSDINLIDCERAGIFRIKTAVWALYSGLWMKSSDRPARQVSRLATETCRNSSVSRFERISHDKMKRLQQ
jgi:hypothetical protein